MNPYFLIGLIFTAFLIWTIGSYSFWRISQANKAQMSRKDNQPALRLAEQWLAESQRKMEDLVQRSEQPLGSAQNELLELRLEAGRLPQGVKSVKSVRESLDTAFKPMLVAKNPQELSRLYLDPDDFRAGDGSLVFLKTPLGEMPCLQAGKDGSPLDDDDMKSALSQLNRALSQSPATGGFLYFGEENQYQACLQKSEWMEGLKAHRLMAVDFRGFTALLLSLRLAKDSEKVVRSFEQGVEATRALTGQSEKMSDDLSRLSAHSLKIRTILEGSHPTEIKEQA